MHVRGRAELYTRVEIHVRLYRERERERYMYRCSCVLGRTLVGLVDRRGLVLRDKKLLMEIGRVQVSLSGVEACPCVSAETERMRGGSGVDACQKLGTSRGRMGDTSSIQS